MVPRIARLMAAVPTVAVLAVGVGGIATAQPPNPETFNGTQGDHDPHAFWVDARAAGMRGTVDDAQALANTICGQLIGGESEPQVIANSGAEGPEGFDAVTFAIHAAEYHFCPQFYSARPS
jgi:hypothetical protein